MNKYMKIPVEIEAIQLTHENKEKIWNWLGDAYISHIDCAETDFLDMDILGLNGKITVDQFDYIIKGIKEGDYYPCKQDIFESSFKEIL